jgi:hypothetical protein
MEKRTNKTHDSKNSDNVNNIVEYIGLSKFEKNPVIQPSDLTQKSKEAPRPLLPDGTSIQQKEKGKK